MAYWSKALIERDQVALFAPTLDSWIPDDHPVRLFDEILSSLDWSQWESQYFGCIGQPPIHPKTLAGVILYGLSMGVRSSRTLERMCANSIDYLWFTSGRRVDHSTLCKFRTRFAKELKGVFRQIGRVSMAMGLIRLNEVGLDGTQVRSNNSRDQVLTAEVIEKRLAELDDKIEQIFAEAQAADDQDQQLFGATCGNSLPRELSTLQKRKQALEKALELERKVVARRSRHRKVLKRPVCVPATDPDSAVLPNKQGGHAPNYTSTVAVDSHRGFLVDADVTGDGHESHMTVPTVDRIEETFDERPDKLLADTSHGTGQNFQDLEDRGIEAYIPAQGYVIEQDNPAHRDDLSEPVAESEWEKLPRKSQLQNKLDRSAFIYDSSSDCYYCPMGRRLEYSGSSISTRSLRKVTIRRYFCTSCADCPLARDCLIGKSKVRCVTHDEFEQARQKIIKRMRSPEGREVYEDRKWLCETPFAVIKGQMQIRQFLLRGLENVKVEWLWIYTSFNLSKLAREMIRMRAEFTAMAA